MASDATIALLGVIVGGLLQWPLEHLRLQGTHRSWLRDKRREAYVSFLDSTRGAYEVIVRWHHAHPAGMSIEDYERHADAVEEAVNRVRFAEGVVTIIGPPHVVTLARKVHARSGSTAGTTRELTSWTCATE
jgi:hypothetical protein